MSNKGTSSKPVSVYLSPKASEILKQYVINSGFGSASRTVEEIILSYHKAYTALLSHIVARDVKSFFDPNSTALLMMNLIGNLDIENGSAIEKLAKNKLSQSSLDIFGVDLVNDIERR